MDAPEATPERVPHYVPRCEQEEALFATDLALIKEMEEAILAEAPSPP